MTSFGSGTVKEKVQESQDAMVKYCSSKLKKKHLLILVCLSQSLIASAFMIVNKVSALSSIEAVPEKNR